MCGIIGCVSRAPGEESIRRIRPAMQSLRAIRDRIPLEVFGIDFDVDADGRVVFYEANATMNLFSTARAEVPYPKDADDGLKLAFQRYFASLVTRR